MKRDSSNLPAQKDAIGTALELYGAQRPFCVADIGSQSGWLKAASHDARNLYISGPMGLATSVALGVALARPDQQVLAIAGDGALAMNLSSLVTIANAAPRNLAVLLVDNAVYEFTDAVPTPTRRLDWLAVGRAILGAEQSRHLSTLDTANWARIIRPALVVADIRISGKPPSLGMSPAQIRESFLAASAVQTVI